MREHEFVDALMSTIRKLSREATVIRPADSYTLGVPDVLGWIPSMSTVWAVAIEAKALHPLMEDPFHRGRRTGLPRAPAPAAPRQHFQAAATRLPGAPQKSGHIVIQGERNPHTSEHRFAHVPMSNRPPVARPRPRMLNQ